MDTGMAIMDMDMEVADGGVLHFITRHVGVAGMVAQGLMDSMETTFMYTIMFM